MSVMHYRQYAFSKNRKPTILPKRPVPHLRCRGLDCPSELDIKKINFLYKCDKKDYDEEDSYSDKEIDNEVNVDDEMMLGKNSFHEQFDPEDIDQRSCLEDEDCYRRYKKPIPYSHLLSLFNYDNVNYRGDLMHRLFFPQQRFLSRHRPMSLRTPLRLF